MVAANWGTATLSSPHSRFDSPPGNHASVSARAALIGPGPRWRAARLRVQHRSDRPLGDTPLPASRWSGAGRSSSTRWSGGRLGPGPLREPCRPLGAGSDRCGAADGTLLAVVPLALWH